MKKILLVLLTIIFFVGIRSTSYAQTPIVEGTGMTAEKIIAEKYKEERNKKNVLDFLQLLMGDHDYDAAEKYMGEYIQHDPKVKGSGMAPLKEYLTTDPQFKNRPKGIKTKAAQVMADGDFVYVQNRKEGPGKKMMVQHVFRLNKEGKIDEHWTTVTIVDLDKSINQQPLY